MAEIDQLAAASKRLCACCTAVEESGNCRHNDQDSARWPGRPLQPLTQDGQDCPYWRKRLPLLPRSGRPAGQGLCPVHVETAVKPRLLDLYCGAGGAAMGLSRAGFDVTGVDIKPQPHYPFAFILADALEVPLKGYDAYWASPPCQRYTSLKAMWNRREHPDLVAPTRERLVSTQKPWIMENVIGAPFTHAIILCGSMFRLGCEGAELRRHRLFETSFPLMSPCTCQHGWSGPESGTVGVYGHSGRYSERQKYCVIGVYGGHGQDRRRRKNGQHFPVAARRGAMGIDWMTDTELSQAIPPAYSEFMGLAMLRAMGL